MPNLHDEIAGLQATSRQLASIAARFKDKVSTMPAGETFVSGVQLDMIQTERAVLADLLELLAPDIAEARKHVGVDDTLTPAQAASPTA